MGISVFVVDHERTFADALAARLEAEDDVDVVAAVHARTPAECLILGRHADVMLLDGDLPERAAIRLCEELCAREQPPRVVVLSRSSEAGRIVDAVRVGAAAWVRKDESLQHLLAVIRGVSRGETWLPPTEAGEVLRLLLQDQERRRDSNRLLSSLTPREWEVLTCLAEGAGRREVAEQLHLSANTVRTHMQNIMAKLGVHSTLEAVAISRPHLRPDAVLSATPARIRGLRCVGAVPWGDAGDQGAPRGRCGRTPRRCADDLRQMRMFQWAAGRQD
jgi:DNA-binding NarL/FixJ family response regulator